MRSGDPVWSPRQRLKNDALYCCAVAGLRLGVALPRPWLAGLGRQIGRTAHACMSRARRQTKTNLRLAYPAMNAVEIARTARQVFGALGEDLLDTVALLDPDEPAARTLEVPEASREVLSQALAHGHGVVYVTGHLGPWERMAALLASEGFPITTIARESYDPRLQRLVYDRLRAGRNVQAIYRGQPGAAFAMLRALRKGRVLGFPMDLPGRVPTLPVRLLGQPARLPIGPARIALRTRAPIVVGTPAPGNGANALLQIRIEPLRAADLPATFAGEKILTQRIADALTDRIAALATHWPWMHPSFDVDEALAVRAAVAAAT